ncbi:hypothetical protein NCC49_003110 [Naganishia albida]|nr:hypothetical protein NCC49_003110 [Naganishia albida]
MRTEEAEHLNREKKFKAKQQQWGIRFGITLHSRICDLLKEGRVPSLLLGECICGRCGLTFVNTSDLARHLVWRFCHTKASGSFGKCQTCGVVRASLKGMKEHLDQESTHMRVLPSDLPPDGTGVLIECAMAVATTITDFFSESESEESAEDMEESAEDMEVDQACSAEESLQGDEIRRAYPRKAEKVEKGEATAAEEEHQPVCLDRWYPGKLAQMTAPAILRISEEIHNDQEVALLLSSTTHDVSNGADLRFPKLRPINVPPETPDTSAQHASHRFEDLHQASRRTDGPSQDAPPKGVCLSDNGETTEDGASDEELIELGENDSINGTSQAPMYMSSDELPAAAATLRDAHSVDDATDGSDDTIGNDSSEEYSSDDVTSTQAVGRVARQKSTSAPEPTKDIATTSEQATRRLRETDKIANVNIQDRWDYGGQTPSIDVDPAFGTRVEPCAIPNDAAIIKSEDDIGLSDKTTISVQVSRDRVASFGSHYACSHCDRTFTTPDALLSHIRSVNENSPWYTCSTISDAYESWRETATCLTVQNEDGERRATVAHNQSEQPQQLN